MKKKTLIAKAQVNFEVFRAFARGWMMSSRTCEC